MEPTRLELKNLFFRKLLIYPKSAQAFKEEYLLTDSLESTNEWYAIAKISGISMSNYS